ncbi:MAG: hypothetical protein VXA39_18120, partial [Deltaproteobacteria bacterium]
MLPKMGRQLDENVLALRSHFKTDLFGDLFLREIVSQKSGSGESLRRIVRRGNQPISQPKTTTSAAWVSN